MDYKLYQGYSGGMTANLSSGNIGNVRQKIKDNGGYAGGALGPTQKDELSYDDTLASRNAAKSGYFDSSGKLKDGYVSSSTPLGGFGDALVSWESRASADYDHHHSDEEDMYLRYKHDGLYIYGNNGSSAAPAPKPTPTPAKKEPTGPVQYSPEIQEAKERVNKYESDIKAGVTSEKIFDANRTYTKDSNLDFSNNLDFSGKTFGANKSPKTNEYASAAQQQMQNYISKYSK
tara:strand:+ start:633 stop:1328 length:696 start_codon:yes stop_codon:yes gene_type:complete